MDFCYCRSAEGVRSLSAPGWNEQSFLATLFSPLPILAFSPSLRQLPRQPPALRPLHVIPKEQKKEKENKKRRASNQERAGVQGKKKKAEEDRRGGKGKDGQPQNAAIAEIFQRHWFGSVSPSVRRDFSTGGTGQHLGGTPGQPAATAETPSSSLNNRSH